MLNTPSLDRSWFLLDPSHKLHHPGDDLALLVTAQVLQLHKGKQPNNCVLKGYSVVEAAEHGHADTDKVCDEGGKVLSSASSE